MKNPEENEIRRNRQKFEAEADSDLLTLSLSLPSSTLPQPKLSSPSPSPLPSTSFPSSSHPKFSPSSSSSLSSSISNHYYSFPIQSLFSQAFPQSPFQLSPTNPLFLPPPLLTEPPLLPTILPATLSTTQSSPSPSRPARIRRNPSHGPSGVKSETVTAPFPWATNRRAMVHSLKYLREKQILTITGKVQCRTCESSYEMGFDLEAKFAEVSSFIATNKCTMHDRAPRVWVNPILPTCKNCGNSVRPVVSERKRSINWLFLLLGQMLGCCTLEQLKYFCKHTNSFRTGAKDRILYLTYLGLCKQLDPTGPFDVRF